MQEQLPNGDRAVVEMAESGFDHDCVGKDCSGQPFCFSLIPGGYTGSDSKKHRVVVYDQNGSRLSVIGKRGMGEGEFNLPTQEAVAPDETLYVLDGGNFRVQVFTPQGKFLRAWGENGRNFGNLARPRGLAVDADGVVYVSDAPFRNVQHFSARGQLLLAIGGEEVRDELGHVYIVDQPFAKIDVLRRLSEKETARIVADRKAQKTR